MATGRSNSPKTHGNVRNISVPVIKPECVTTQINSLDNRAAYFPLGVPVYCTAKP